MNLHPTTTLTLTDPLTLLLLVLSTLVHNEARHSTNPSHDLRHDSSQRSIHAKDGAPLARRALIPSLFRVLDLSRISRP